MSRWRLVHLGLLPEEVETVVALLEQEADGIEGEQKWVGVAYATRRVRFLRKIVEKMKQPEAE